jgi:predicted component of type VI protein secretion system
MADVVAKQIHRKLLGHEMIYSPKGDEKDGTGISQKQPTAPGMFKLAVLAATNNAPNAEDEKVEAKKTVGKEKSQCDAVEETKKMSVAEQVFNKLNNKIMELEWKKSLK